MYHMRSDLLLESTGRRLKVNGGIYLLHPARLMYCLFAEDLALGGQLDGLLPFLVALL